MNRFILFVLIGISLVVTSCVPTKDLMYLQNKDNSKTSEGINQVVSKPYRLQVNDIVVITIKAIDEKLVAMFNPTETNSTTKRI